MVIAGCRDDETERAPATGRRVDAVGKGSIGKRRRRLASSTAVSTMLSNMIKAPLGTLHNDIGLE